jgi:hypothetical protein
LIPTRAAFCLALLLLGGPVALAEDLTPEQREGEKELSANWVKANERVTLTAAEARAIGIVIARCRKEEPSWKDPWVDLDRDELSEDNAFHIACYTSEHEGFFSVGDEGPYTRLTTGGLEIVLSKETFRVVDTYYMRF